MAKRWVVGPWCAALLAAWWPALGVAQDAPPTLDVQRFMPWSQRPGFSIVRDAEAVPRFTFTGSLAVNYALNPFELGDADTGERTIGAVDHLIGFDVGAGFAPTSWLHLAVDLPVLEIIANSDESKAVAAELGANASGAGIGDLRLSVGFYPVRQRDNGALSFAIVPYLSFPTGSRLKLVGSGAFHLGLDLALGGRWKHFRFTTSAGYVWLSPTEPVGTVVQDDEFRWGVGLAVPFGERDRFEVEAEWVGGAVVTPATLAEVGARPFANRQTPTELLFGFAWRPDAPFWLKVGAGPGLTHGFGSPDVRAFAQVGGILRSKDETPRDADGDGYLDPDDLCPSEPEDFDGYRDEDGCPEPDNDLDRVLDVDDLCPLDPEDYDTWQDADGCPDPDNDADLIPDLRDQCMMEPEDYDGWRDEDGCPEPDNDLDTFLDPVDACPNDPETINGVDDTDGCPDEALARVDIERNEILIFEKIYFELDKAILRPESWPVIEAVANVMRAYKDIGLVEVQGHTDSRGSDAYNLDLSQRRAAAVVEALVELGVDPARLIPKGYGESRPVVPNAATERDFATNRRVQFVILRRGEGAAPAR
ncbi:MAG: OmpA family protein [Alphaproteobacteria bacterium]|nr:OmpA family protein [Alphaproteobacteria bacterium]